MESANPTEPPSQPSSDSVSKDSSQTTARRHKTRHKNRRNDDLPKDERGRVDKKRIGELFFASPYVEWAPFAQNQGWDPARTYAVVPAKVWCERKKQQQLDIQEQHVKQLWHDCWDSYTKDVATTLKKFPMLADLAAVVAQRRLKDLAEMPSDKFRRVWSKDLREAIQAAKMASEMKYQTLLLDRYGLKPIEERVEKGEQRAIAKQTETGADQWTLEVMGEGKVSSKRLQEIMSKYYDEPITVPSELIEVQEDEG